MQAMSTPFWQILAAVWHRRGYQGSRQVLLVISAMVLLPPLALIALVKANTQLPPELFSAMRLRWICGAICELVAVVLWVAIVASVLEQNQPAMARLVPGHARRLRRFLLSAWAVMVVATGALPGLAWGSPLAAITGAAVLLTAVAAMVRWPLLTLGLALAPLLWIHVYARLPGGFEAHVWASTLAVSAACVALLASFVREGGTRHGSAYAARRDRNRRAQARQVGCSTAGIGGGWWAAIAAWPYFWWLQRQLARPGSTVGSRLLLGLGPSLHWTARLSKMFWTVAGFGAGAALGGSLMANVARGVLAGAAVGVLFSAVTPSLQIRGHLWQTRGEQALLALLPGVPRRGALNRWLGLQMTLNFAISLAGGVAISWALRAMADAIGGGDFIQAWGDLATVIAAALLLMAPMVWRRWDRLSAPNSLTAAVPMMVVMALIAALSALHWWSGLSIAPPVAAGLVASVLWCVRRWREAGDEPEHLPAGRGAR